MRIARARIAGTTALLALALAGCLPPGTDEAHRCDEDGDCATNLCSRNNVCTTEDQIQVVTTTWTFGGAAPTAASCAGVDQLEITYTSPSYDEDLLSYAPVPCPLGSFALDRIPRGYDTVYLRVVLGSGSEIVRAASIARAGAAATARVDFPAR